MLKYIGSPMDEMCSEEIKNIMSTEYGYSEDMTKTAYNELYSLYKDEMLFAERNYNIEIKNDYPVKALCLHIAHDCNMRCKYCFAEGGDFAQGRKLMTFEVAKKAIDFIIAKSENRVNLEVDFFGGEPLMGFDVVKKTVEYARSIEKENNKNFRFTITTNGILLNDEIMDYINKEMSNVVLSLDGRKTVNDNVRIRVGGSGSYDAIVPKFKKFVEKRGNGSYYIRGTFTSENLDFSEDVMHIKDLGFEQVSVEPVVLNENSPYALKEEHLPKIFDEYEKLALKLNQIKEKGEFFNFFHFMIDLEQGPCVIKRVKGCGSGSEYVSVSPEGDIYPCHRFVGKHEFFMGNVLENNELNPKIKEMFTASTVLNKPECDRCWAKYFCSGGCAANNFNSNSDILKPHKISCELEKKRIECAIMLKASEAMREE
ncbi:MAG: hypothetical protein K0S55_1986, partial [Clostridia bacterium]|nr:hypothetical protein [Clostridia bacterium]